MPTVTFTFSLCFGYTTTKKLSVWGVTTYRIYGLKWYYEMQAHNQTESSRGVNCKPRRPSFFSYILNTSYCDFSHPFTPLKRSEFRHGWQRAQPEGCRSPPTLVMGLTRWIEMLKWMVTKIRNFIKVNKSCTQKPGCMVLLMCQHHTFHYGR